MRWRKRKGGRDLIGKRDVITGRNREESRKGPEGRGRIMKERE